MLFFRHCKTENSNHFAVISDTDIITITDEMVKHKSKLPNITRIVPFNKIPARSSGILLQHIKIIKTTAFFFRILYCNCRKRRQYY